MVQHSSSISSNNKTNFLGSFKLLKTYIFWIYERRFSVIIASTTIRSLFAYSFLSSLPLLPTATLSPSAAVVNMCPKWEVCYYYSLIHPPLNSVALIIPQFLFGDKHINHGKWVFWRLCVWYANFLCLIISFCFSLNLWLKCLKISLRSLWIFSVKLTPYHYWDLHFKPKPTWHSNAAVFVFCSYKYMSMQNTLTICLLDLLMSFSYFIPSPRKLLNTSCLPTRMLVLFSKAKKISGASATEKSFLFLLI